MLNQMRIGIVEPATVEQFSRLERPLYYDDGLEPMQLYVFLTTQGVHSRLVYALIDFLETRMY